MKSSVLLLSALVLVAACSSDPTSSDMSAAPTLAACDAQAASGPLTPRLHCNVSARYSAELTTLVTPSRGTFVYTSTWGRRTGATCTTTNCGNVVYVWNVTAQTPGLVDSLVVADVSRTTTTGDVQVSDDGSLLVVATEPAGSIVTYSLADPARPKQLSSFTTPNLANGVHTAQISRVGGKLYCFCSIDPRNGARARLTVVDLSDPSNPREVFSQEMGNPYVHDVFVRDGYLFTALWDDGVSIWDIGARGTGTPASPKLLGNVRTVGGEVHNVWWGGNGSRFAFVGQEGVGSVGSSSSGDVHVIDVSDMTKPTEVAALTIAGAGTHNFSVDEARGVLYAAYYNGGVQAIDIRGDLASCGADQRFADGRCDLVKSGHRLASGLTVGRSVYMWGVEYNHDAVYASDMIGGLWVLDPVIR